MAQIAGIICPDARGSDSNGSGPQPSVGSMKALASIDNHWVLKRSKSVSENMNGSKTGRVCTGLE